jgi:hypothetical protein
MFIRGETSIRDTKGRVFQQVEAFPLLFRSLKGGILLILIPTLR